MRPEAGLARRSRRIGLAANLAEASRLFALRSPKYMIAAAAAKGYTSIDWINMYLAEKMTIFAYFLHYTIQYELCQFQTMDLHLARDIVL